MEGENRFLQPLEKTVPPILRPLQRTLFSSLPFTPYLKLGLESTGLPFAFCVCQLSRTTRPKMENHQILFLACICMLHV